MTCIATPLQACGCRENFSVSSEPVFSRSQRRCPSQSASVCCSAPRLRMGLTPNLSLERTSTGWPLRAVHNFALRGQPTPAAQRKR